MSTAAPLTVNIKSWKTHPMRISRINFINPNKSKINAWVSQSLHTEHGSEREKWIKGLVVADRWGRSSLTPWKI